MPTDRWHRLEVLFTEAAEQPPQLRADFLTRTCGPDATLRDEVTSMLNAAERSGDFLCASAMEVFARQVAREGWNVKPGERIGSYTVEQRLGAGGMGEVWRARDERLGRDVAIKLLLPNPSNSHERVHTLQDEARAAGTLNHTNVLTVYDVGDHNGAPYLVTECLEGQSLRARLHGGPLPVDESLDVALQVARGLGAAHARGIVHRDLKPENIFLAADGRVKILDFGLATFHDPEAQAPPGSGSAETMRSLVAGTAGYMAPEQVRGEKVDRRADIFALGAVLYEILAGERPFKGGSVLSTLHAVLNHEPLPLSEVKAEIPTTLSDIVLRCLAKSRDDRFESAGDVESALEAVSRTRRLPRASRLVELLRRPIVMVVAATVILAAAAGVWRWRVATSRAHWARTIAAPEAQRLFNRGEYAEAFLLAREALDAVPDDPIVRQLWLDASLPAALNTDPAGAEVALAPYRNPRDRWLRLGSTPLEGVRVPRGPFRVRASKPGLEPVEGSGHPGGVQRYRLFPAHEVPTGMVYVRGGHDVDRFGEAGEIEDFWLDRFEVTNRQFKEFVDRGGYRERGFWKEPFIEGGRLVPWDQAVGRFRDATGQPGPASWRSGTYPEGRGEFPVGGVSWYEAAAYAAFAGKSLPTVYHWYAAAALGRFADILTVSNFSGVDVAAVGRYPGLGPFGTYDMAGNVKEWCSTETGTRRFILGGAWNEPMYMFADKDARGPFERAPGYGFRLAKYLRPLPPGATAPFRVVASPPHAYEPVSDEIFAVFRRQHTYDDPAPLNAVVEAIEETASWTKHTIAIDAAYGGERMRLYLFLPRKGSPPYQTVIFFPGADTLLLRSSRDLTPGRAAFILENGRALLFPIYRGTFERKTSGQTGSSAYRDAQIAWSRDFGRALDYLETRPDVDAARLGFYGVSMGADAGVILTALESRLSASVLQGIGMWSARAPETDMRNYAPRVHIPTLVLNGRYDFDAPFETVQRPLFDLLGTPAAHKRLTVLEAGHAVPVDDAAREILPWLDRYLGPVAAPPPASTASPAPNLGR